MDSKLISPSGKNVNNNRQSITKKLLKGNPDEAGLVGQLLGTGDNAKNSIVWLTIKWSLLIGCAITAALYFKPAYCGINDDLNFINDLKVVWSIFMPVITLALGYIFGKSK